MGTLPVLPDDEATRQSVMRRRRLRIYRVALPGSLPLVLLPLLLHHATPYLNTYDQWTLPVLAAAYLLMAALSWTCAPMRALDIGNIVVLSAYTFGRLAWVLADRTDVAPAATLAATVPWMVAVLLVNAWILYDRPRVGVVLNFTLLTVLCVVMAVWWPGWLPTPQRQHLISALTQLLGLSAAVVAAQVLIARQGAALVLLAEQSRQQALTDVLTGLPNRRALLDTLAGRADGPGGVIGVALLDVDHFKAVNDTHGHAFGDEVLRHVAARLSGHLIPGGVVGRYGGEEFLALLPVPDEAAGVAAAERLRAAIEAEPVLGQRVTISVGVTVAATPCHPVTVLEIADAALYRAKASGRNAVRSAPDPAPARPVPAVRLEWPPRA